MTGTLLCPHILGTSGDALRFAREAQSPIIKLVDDFGAAPEYAALPHRPLIIGRVHVSDEIAPMDMLTRDPIEAARWDFFRRQIVWRAGPYPEIKAWEGPNEPVCKTVESMRWYSAFERERVHLLASIGRQAVIGNFSTGQPEPELWAEFKIGRRLNSSHSP